MKKEEKDFETELRERLEYLAQQESLALDRVRDQALPKLRDVLAEEPDTPWAFDANRRRRGLIEELVDQFCDERFAFLVWSEKVIGGLIKYGQSVSDEVLNRAINGLSTDWKIVPKIERFDLLTLDSKEWHSYKNALGVYKSWASVVLKRLPADAPPEVRKNVADLQKRGTKLLKMASHIRSIMTLTRKKEEVDVFKSLAWIVNYFQKSLRFKLESDLPKDQSPRLILPESMLWDLVSELHTNANQAMSPDALAPPVLRARVVEGNGVFDAMEVKLEGSTTQGGFPSPGLRKSDRYLYVGVVNQGDPIPEEIRRGMLVGQRFTTKEFGSGTGLVLVHEYLKETGGVLLVASRDGKTEIGALIPFKGNLPEDDPVPPEGGPTGSGEESPGMDLGETRGDKEIAESEEEPGEPVSEGVSGEGNLIPFTAPPSVVGVQTFARLVA